MKAGDVSFIHVADGPNRRQVGDDAQRVGVVERLGKLARRRAQFDDDARARCPDRELIGRAVGIGAEQVQTRAGAFERRGRAQGICLRLLVVPQRDHVVLVQHA